MAYYVRLMHKDDIRQVNEIDREAFPTQWPPPNYRHEIENQLARYIVVCDDSRKVDQPDPPRPRGLSGFALKVRRWFKPGADGQSPASDSREVVGFAGIWIMADESHLTNIAVRTSYQRKGLGELLLISIIDLSHSLKADLVTLEVRVSNTLAQKLYLKYGFIETGVRRAYYTDNREDAMLMSTNKIASPEYQALFQQLKQAYATRYGSACLRRDMAAQPGRL